MFVPAGRQAQRLAEIRPTRGSPAVEDFPTFSPPSQCHPFRATKALAFAGARPLGFSIAASVGWQLQSLFHTEYPGLETAGGLLARMGSSCVLAIQSQKLAVYVNVRIGFSAPVLESGIRAWDL